MMCAKCVGIGIVTAVVLLTALADWNYSGDEDAMLCSSEAFVPRWAVGDWWIVGVSPLRVDSRGRRGAAVSIDKPTRRFRFDVVRKALVESSLCYVVEIRPLHETPRKGQVNTIYYETTSLRPLKHNSREIPWRTLGPAVDVGTYNPYLPWMPQFPLSSTGFSGGEQRVSTIPSEGDEWEFLGKPSVSLYSGLRAAQITSILLAIDTLNTIGARMGGFSVPAGPYYEVLIAHGAMGERVMRQIWHRDLPWFLFCEDSDFPIEPAPADRPGTSTIFPRVGHTAVQRGDLSKATPYVRAWLLGFKQG
jgi:hypothetical protein